MKYRSLGSIASSIASVVLISNTAIAATFNGYDLNTSSPLIPLTKVTAPSSEGAFKTFSDNLADATVTTESFEGVSGAINGLIRTISNTTATFSYTQKNPTDPNNPGVPGTATTSVQKANGTTGFTNSGTYPTDGIYGISINSENNFSISFSNSLAAFGYFGTDLGDGGNILTMKFFNGNTLVNSTAVPTNVGSANSSEFFFGFIADSPAEEFNRVEFVSSISGNGDAIGIDQIKVATSSQVKKIPEPASIWGTLLCGGCLVAIKRRSKRARSILVPRGYANEK
jgi:hypothetical protein